MATRWIAHRGGAGLRMENTLAAFAHALALGAAGAELDVHLSRDGQVVVHHDDRLNPGYCRHVDGSWIGRDQALPLARLTHAQMLDYDISAPRPDSTYARTHEHLVSVPGQRIPLLREVIELASARSPDFVLVIEIKASLTIAAQCPWVDLVDATLALIEDFGFRERAVLCSFDWGSLRYARQRCPGLATWHTSLPLSWFADGPVPASDLQPEAGERRALQVAAAAGDAPWYAGCDPRRFGGNSVEAVAAAGGSAWFAWHRDFDARVAQEAARLGLDTAVWSSNLRDDAEIQRLLAAGVGNLVADFPLSGCA